MLIAEREKEKASLNHLCLRWLFFALKSLSFLTGKQRDDQGIEVTTGEH